MNPAEFLMNASLIAGTFFCVVAVVGILRMPDVFLRIHTVSKASTLGVALLALATCLKFWGSPDFAPVATKCALIVIFLLLTAPVSAHLIGRAAKNRGNALSERTTLDEYDL
jgi:multicomponent Na+:H+ antiporter subunit G